MLLEFISNSKLEETQYSTLPEIMLGKLSFRERQCQMQSHIGIGLELEHCSLIPFMLLA